MKINGKNIKIAVAVIASTFCFPFISDFWVGPAYAQTVVKQCVQSTSDQNQCIPVDGNNGVPVTIVGAGTGTVNQGTAGVDPWPVTVNSSALPSGASTSALQNSIIGAITASTVSVGVAGTPATDVMTVQGASGMTALDVSCVSGCSGSVGSTMIGGVGGITQSVIQGRTYIAVQAITPALPIQRMMNTITAANATVATTYASGQAVMNLVTFSNVARITGGSGLIQKAQMFAKTNQGDPYELWLYNANPSSSTCTANVAFAGAVADYDKLVGVIPINQWFSAGTPSLGQSALPSALSFKIPTNDNETAAKGNQLYGCLVTRGTPTYGSTSDITVGLGIEAY